MLAFQKRWPVMRGKEFVKNGARKWTKFCNFSETFLAIPEGLHCIPQNISVCGMPFGQNHTVYNTSHLGKLSYNLGIGNIKMTSASIKLHIIMKRRSYDRLIPILGILMPPVTSHSRAPYGMFSGLFPGWFEQKLYVHSWGPHRPRAPPYKFCPPPPPPVNACIISLWAPYGFWDCKQPVNRPCGDCKGPVLPNTMPVRDFDQLWLCPFPYVSVRAPYGTLAGHARALYGSRIIWKTLNIPLWGRTMPLRASHGVPVESCELFNQTISMQTCQSVSWCDHGNSSDVKFLWTLHPALRARNRTGDKNRTGSVVGCDEGIIYIFIEMGTLVEAHHKLCCIHSVVTLWNDTYTCTHGYIMTYWLVLYPSKW